MRRTVIDLGARCNNRCVHCGLGELRNAEARAEDVAAALEAVFDDAAHGLFEQIVFVGGEPTLHEALPSWVARARDLGARSVVVQTNARRLAYASYARTLAAAGVTDLDVALYGAAAASHDFHTRVEGSFAQTTAGIRNARAARLRVGVSALITRPGWRELPETVALAARLGAERVHLCMTSARGAAGADFDRVVPRVGMLAERVAEAVRVARAARLLTVATGLPLCAMGEAAEAGQSPPTRVGPEAVSVAEGSDIRGPGDGGHDLAGRAYGPACERCAVRARCGGVEAEYAARVNLAELVPFDEAPAARPDLAAAARGAAATFVGLVRGEGARPAPERAAAADVGLVQLRTLGATAPGKQELRTPMKRKTGDELKDLFPGLYGGAMVHDGGKASGE